MVCAETWHGYQRAAFLGILYNQMKKVNILLALAAAEKSMCADWTWIFILAVKIRHS